MRRSFGLQDVLMTVLGQGFQRPRVEGQLHGDEQDENTCLLEQRWTLHPSRTSRPPTQGPSRHTQPRGSYLARYLSGLSYVFLVHRLILMGIQPPGNLPRQEPLRRFGGNFSATATCMSAPEPQTAQLVST